MRVRVVRAGNEESADVDLVGGTVEIAGRRHSFVVISASPMKAELEIAGEKVVVEQWPEGMPIPPGPVDVNGERWTLTTVETSRPRTDSAALPPIAAPVAPTPPAGRGTPILPPMPGKAIEVRVHDGEHVEKGQILLILEAMKMRNEIVSPVAGTIERLQVRAGSSVRAREPMLFVVPD